MDQKVWIKAPMVEIDMMKHIHKIVGAIIEKVLFGTDEAMMIDGEFLVDMVDRVFQLGFLKGINPLSLFSMGLAFKF